MGRRSAGARARECGGGCSRVESFALGEGGYVGSEQKIGGAAVPARDSVGDL